MCWCSCRGAIDMRLVAFLFIAGAPLLSIADDSPVAADVTTGKAVYSQTCIACHGSNGKGAIPGVRDLTDADGPLAKSDEELIGSITDGFQSPGAAMAMPPKGGNPTLTADDINAVLSYLRAEFGSSRRCGKPTNACNGSGQASKC